MPTESPQEGPFTSYNSNEGATAVPENMSPILDRPVPYLPYRGAMYHGVHPTPESLYVAEELPDDASLTEVYHEPEEDLNPVAVKIVDTAAHEYKQWRAWQAFANAASPSMVANRKEGQSSLRIRHASTSGTDRVWLGPDTGVSIYTGYPLDPGGEVSFSGEAPVYAIAHTGVVGNVTLAVLSEFSTAQ
jgi:hypothetical protein